MKSLFKAMVLAPVAVGMAASAQAADMSTLDKADAVATQAAAAGQVTSISQLSDVKPTDWAYQALQSLVERYGCIVGYPNKTYQGNKALSRYEFAAGLNACIDKVTEYAASKEDLETLKRLLQEFQVELATLRGRVDALDAKVAELQAQQFSTTTKLQGNVILSLDQAYNPSGTNTGVSFGSKVTLGLNTSFTGKDLLRTTLAYNNIVSPAFRGGDNTASSLAYDNYGNGTFAEGLNFSNSSFYLEKLYYKFPVNNLNFTVGVSGMQVRDILATTGTFYNPTISNFFGTSDPGIYGDVATSGQAGLGFNWQISKNFNWGVAYIAQSGAVNGQSGGGTAPGGGGTVVQQASGTQGLFSLGNSITTQFAFKSDTGNVIAALAYSYRNGNALAPGLNNSNGQYFGGVNFGTLNAFGTLNGSVGSNNIGFSIGWAASPNFTLNASYGIGFLSFTGAPGLSTSGTATVQSWKVASSFPNLFAKGNELGLAVGQVPFVTAATGTVLNGPADSGNFAFESYYKFQLTDNISITPGIYLVTNQQQNIGDGVVNRGAYVIPVLKTEFKF